MNPAPTLPPRFHHLSENLIQQDSGLIYTIFGSTSDLSNLLEHDFLSVFATILDHLHRFVNFHRNGVIETKSWEETLN